jgi:tetratricopeptide (TPR) repeat protein
MKRQLSLKALLVLLVALLLGTGTHFLHAYQVSRNARALRDQAEREQGQGNTEAALRYLDSYLQLRPRDDEARERFLSLLAGQPRGRADRERVLLELERVLGSNPGRDDLRRQAAKAALGLGRPDDALVHLNLLAEMLPDDAGVRELRGDALALKMRYADAAKAYAEAVKIDPHRVTCYAARATLLQTRLEDPRGADDVIAEMRRANEGSAKALLAWARYQLEFKGSGERVEAREEILANINKLADEEPDALLLAAEIEQADRNLDAARDLLRRGMDRSPEDYRYPLALARVELAAGRPGKARRLVTKARQHLPDRVMAVFAAAELLLDAGATEDARSLMGRFGHDELSSGIRSYLAARLDMAIGEWLRALEDLRHAQVGIAPVPELLKQSYLLAAACHRQLGSPDQELADCRAALQVDPTWLPALLAQAAAVQELGRAVEAARLYTGLVDRTAAARLPAARLWLAVRNSVKDERPLNRTAALLDGAPAATRDGPPYRLLRVQLLAAQGKLADAAKEAEAATKAHPTAVSLWVARADVAFQAKHPDQAADVLARGEKAAGDHAAIRLARVRLLCNSGKGKEAEGLLRDYETDGAKLPADEVKEWLGGLAALHLVRGERDAAERDLSRLAALRPKDLSVRAMLLDVLLARPDPERLKAVVEELRGLEGDEGTLWRFAEAARLVSTTGAGADERGKARNLLAEVTRRRPGWAAPLALAGLLEQQDGNLDAAATRLQQAVDLGERRPEVVRRLVGLYLRGRRYAEAQAVVNRLQGAEVVGVLGRLAAEVALSSREDPEQTLRLARQAVPDGSRDFRDHLWLGQLLWSLQRHDEAEKELRRAAELGKDRPEPCVVLVQLLVARDRRERAREAIAAASGKFPPEVAPLALAACWEAVGDRAQAAAQYRKALEARPEDPTVLEAAGQFHLRGGETEKARVLLRRVLEARDVPAGLAARTRRSLALALAAEGTYQGTTQAVALLKENAAGGRASAEDRRALALIQARWPAERKEAVRNLEAAFLQAPPTDDERYLLAFLHAANQDWPRAREEFRRLLAGGPAPNPAHSASFVQMLIHQGELDEAAHWLAVLEKAQPKELRTAVLKARLLHARKDRDGALAVLVATASQGDRDPARLLVVGRLLDDFGRHEEAEPFFRDFARGRGKDDPAGVVPLVVHLARRDRLGEALDLCEQLRGKVPDEAMAAVWVGTLRVGRPGPGHLRRVEAWIGEASRAAPGKLVFALALADLRDAQGRPDEAEKIYRDVLRHDGHNLLALNNLAALLAFREEGGDEALRLIGRAIEASGPQPGFLDTRASVYLARKQWDLAARDLEEVVSMEAAPASYLRLARAYLMSGDRRAARSAFRKATAGGAGEADLHPLERPAYGPVFKELQGG